MKSINTLLWRQTLALLACLGLVSSNLLVASEALVAHSADGKQTASADSLGRISYRPAGSNSVVHTFYICHPQALAFSEDGRLLAAVSGRNGRPARVKVWRVSDHKQLCDISTSGADARLIAVSSDDLVVVSSDQKRDLETWRISDGTRQWSFTAAVAIQSMRFSVDADALVVRGVDGTDALLDRATGCELSEPSSTDRQEPASR